MGGLRHSLRLLAVLGVLSGSALAQETANDSNLAKMLKYRPSLPGVDYDTPADEATRNACKVEPVLTAQNKNIGYALRNAQGKMLRRFVGAGQEDGPVELLPGWVRGLSRRRLEWRLTPGRMSVAQLRRQSNRPGRAGKDQGLEADFGRRGLEGAGPGTCGR